MKTNVCQMCPSWSLRYNNAPSIKSFTQIALKRNDLVPTKYVNIVFYWLICSLIWILHDLVPFPIVNIVFYYLIITVAGFDSWNSFKDGFACWKKVIFLFWFVDLFVQYGRPISILSKYHFRIVITNSWPMNDDRFKHCRTIKTW